MTILVGAAAAPGCGSSPSPPAQAPPVITVSGVTDGATYSAPVTIVVAVDKGVYTATLDGSDFLSGTTVADAGSHTLVVEARDGERTSRTVVAFQITLASDRVLIVRMFNLGDNESGGGGDAILVTDSSEAGSSHVLLDAGPSGVEGADSTFVARRLEALGVDTLDALVLSHAHSDHFYGLPAVVRQVHVKRFFYNGQVRSFFRYDATIDFAVARADSTFVPSIPVTRTFGGADAPVMTVLPPLAAYLAMPGADGTQLNEGSLGVSIVFANRRLFFTGDGEREANARWRNEFGTLTSGLTVLKVGHHGANDAVFDVGSSGASSWLDHVDPEVALVTANGRSHPRQGATAALLGRGIETWCTNVHGEVTLRLGSDGRFSVTVETDAGQPCRAGTEAGT